MGRQAAAVGMMERSVMEALDRLASPEVRDAILARAFREVGAEAIPENPAAARRFVEGPLRTATANRLHEEGAEALMSELAPILARAEGQAPTVDATGVIEPLHGRGGMSSTPPALRTPGASPRELRLVLVASMDRAGVQRVSRRLIGRAEVLAVKNVFELVYTLEASAARAPVVVIDCCLPTAEPPMLAGMLTSMGASPAVILWGVSEQERSTLARNTPLARDWIGLDSTANDTQVTALLSSMLGA